MRVWPWYHIINIIGHLQFYFWGDFLQIKGSQIELRELWEVREELSFLLRHILLFYKQKSRHFVRFLNSSVDNLNNESTIQLILNWVYFVYLVCWVFNFFFQRATISYNPNLIVGLVIYLVHYFTYYILFIYFFF